jgi:hypothetical protein
MEKKGKTSMELLHEEYSHQHLINESMVKWYSVEDVINAGREIANARKKQERNNDSIIG